MKRTVLVLLASILFITSALGFGIALGRLWRPHRSMPVAEAELIVPDQREVVMTLPPLVITVPRPRPPHVIPRVTLNAAIIPPDIDIPSDPPALLCGAWRPLATDETQTVRYCEPR